MKLRGTLEPGEHTLASTRAHGVQLLPTFIWGFCSVVAWSFSSALWSQLPWVAYVALALALWCLYRAARAGFRWVGTCYILTSHRLVIRRGFNTGADVSVPWRTVEGMTLGRRALMGTVRAGHLTVHARGVQHVLRDVPDPEKFSHAAQRVQESFLRSQGFYAAG